MKSDTQQRKSEVEITMKKMVNWKMEGKRLGITRSSD